MSRVHPRARLRRGVARVPTRFAALAVVLALAGLTSAYGHAAKQNRGGIPHVGNSDTPTQSVAVVQLEKLWEIGVSSEADEELFGVIADIAVDESGRVYLFDLQLEEIKVFSSTGEYVRTIGRPGEGPGDFSAARSFFLLPDAKLCLIQDHPLRMTLFDLQGNPAGQLRPLEAIGDGDHFLPNAVSRGGILVVASYDNVTGKGVVDQIRRVVRVDFDGNEVAEFLRNVRRIDYALKLIKEKETNPFRWTVGPEGRIYVNPSFDYHVELWSPDGELLRTNSNASSTSIVVVGSRGQNRTDGI